MKKPHAGFWLATLGLGVCWLLALLTRDRLNGILLAGAALALIFTPAARRKGAALAALGGIGMDGLWSYSGVLHYSGQHGLPLWAIALWIGFGCWWYWLLDVVRAAPGRWRCWAPPSAPSPTPCPGSWTPCCPTCHRSSCCCCWRSAGRFICPPSAGCSGNNGTAERRAAAGKNNAAGHCLSVARSGLLSVLIIIIPAKYNPMLSQPSRSVLPLIGALFTLYIVWGSTYFVIRLGVAQWPPLMMAGIRFLTAGIVLFSFLAWRGHALPTPKQWLAAGVIGILLLAVGNGLVTVAEHQHVPSGIAAVMVATVPLFTLCFSLLWGMRNTKLEWAGIALGLVGIVLLNTGNNLVGNPTGALLILLASASWAFGSVLGSRISLPVGPMAGAAEMLVAGVVLLVASRLSGEHLTQLPSTSGFLALGYLIVFGSMLAISAYMFLLKNVRPAVATSYAYVNPVVAVLLGIGFAGESLAPREWLALAIIVAAVVLVTLGKYLFARPARVQAIDSER